MKVYLPAVEGYVPAQMLRALSAFLDFCYLVRRNTITTKTLAEIEAALARYHQERTIFEESGVCPNGFSLPRQHSLSHYPYLITEFAAPNGLCSSITESKHIKAVKEPWRRSSKFEAIEQILTINNRLDALAATRVDFEERGLLRPTDPDPVLPTLNPTRPDLLEEDDDDNPEMENTVEATVVLAKRHFRTYPKDPFHLSKFLGFPTLPSLIRRFLHGQIFPDDDLDLVDPLSYPDIPARIKVFPSAIAAFHAPSDCGHGVVPNPRFDCVYASGSDEEGFRGLLAARVLLFMSFTHRRVEYPCALVTWFSPTDDMPCPDVGMWMVQPDLDDTGDRIMDIIHLDTIALCAQAENGARDSVILSPADALAARSSPRPALPGLIPPALSRLLLPPFPARFPLNWESGLVYSVHSRRWRAPDPALPPVASADV
ncbi:hypothetical protein MIND_00394900 [Mycena indigotica]|uniref:Uncharacterized protein n=1 Tax=Mycena indigotica TaxID=2126181 RepID=A0A8H6T5A5_9AGAR|nr:uncharacterized protein MIND_00394900 [Mycena indigotica]KAF7310212.1 hypothetical protein MIND_00394900 [Mycena indigotica]